jgi:polysaccharide export outer membrane protein
MKQHTGVIEAVSGFINRGFVAALIGALSLMAGCSSKSVKKETLEKVPPKNEAYETKNVKTASSQMEPFRAGPYTRLSISVYNEPELTEEVAVLPEGTIDYAYIGKVDVKGLTLPEVEKKLTQALKEYLVYPRVSVKLKELGIIYVFGEIKNPGILTLREQQTPLQVIADAGGFSSRAQKKSIEIVRTVAGEKKSFLLSFKETEGGGLDLLKTFYLQPGDTVIIE